MRIVIQGRNANSFREGFSELLDAPHSIEGVSDAVDTPEERAAFAAAEVIIGGYLSPAMPKPAALLLWQSPGAGVDAIDTGLLPPGATLCNVYEHEHAIAEYVMAALLLRHVDIPRADTDLKRGEWTFWANAADTAHEELRGKTIGLLGFGHIGKAVAVRARPFGLRVHSCNRGAVTSSDVDQVFPLTELHEFLGSADFILASLPLLPQTTGIIGQAELAAMRPDGVILNVGRGGVIDEQALFNALAERRIGGAVIDTWYRYPPAPGVTTRPSTLPFHELPNIVMTPHMSGWTTGTIRRRRETMARNINRLARGEPLMNVVYPS